MGEFQEKFIEKKHFIIRGVHLIRAPVSISNTSANFNHIIKKFEQIEYQNL